MALRVLFFLALSTSLVNVYLALTTNPDVILWTWFGYKFGINWNDFLAFKMLSVICWVLYIIAIEIKDEGDNNSDNSSGAYNIN
jgi:hypothetical protein